MFEEDKLKTYVENIGRELPSTIKNLLAEYYHGRLHYKLVSQMAWYKIRCYVKLPIIRLSKEAYYQSQFFNTFPIFYDEIE
jgi:hypothetical protein